VKPRNSSPVTDAVTITCQLRRYEVNTVIFSAIIEEIRASLGLDDYQVGITFVGSRAIRTLNHQFRGYDKVTDVLSFPQIEWPKPVPMSKKPNIARRAARRSARIASRATVPLLLGDIVISIPQAAINAANIGQTLERELCFLVVHGFLHLCGYDHIAPKDEKLMLKVQREVMRNLGEDSRRPIWRNCVKATSGRRKRA